MASTNKTPYFELSQYQPEDRPTYLGDYNSDMSKIDTAMREISVISDSASNGVASLRDAVNDILNDAPVVQDALNHLEADITAINASLTTLNGVVSDLKENTQINFSQVRDELSNKYDRQLARINEKYIDIDNDNFKGTLVLWRRGTVVWARLALTTKKQISSDFVEVLSFGNNEEYKPYAVYKDLSTPGYGSECVLVARYFADSYGKIEVSRFSGNTIPTGSNIKGYICYTPSYIDY